MEPTAQPWHHPTLDEWITAVELVPRLEFSPAPATTTITITTTTATTTTTTSAATTTTILTTIYSHYLYHY